MLSDNYQILLFILLPQRQSSVADGPQAKRSGKAATAVLCYALLLQFIFSNTSNLHKVFEKPNL